LGDYVRLGRCPADYHSGLLRGGEPG